MPVEVVYVVRHGFRSGWSVNPATGTYTSAIRTPTGIPADLALTAYGVGQAKELGRHLMTLDPPIEAVYSSPYYRCLQTISPFIELQQEKGHSTAAAVATIRPEHGLSEWFGSAPFDHPAPAAPDTLKSMFPSYDVDYVSAMTPSRKGETLAELYHRVGQTVQKIIAQCDAEGHRTMVLCTHAAVVIALGRILTGKIPEDPETEDFGAFTCGLSVFRRHFSTSTKQGGSLLREDSSNATEEDPAAWTWECEVDSNCDFLSSGAERGWRFSGDESFPGTGSMTREGDASSKL